ncbi:MAG: hypothetical protein OSB62_01230 [Alphaproteobacteria bacterium]|nr:hypothetical protein [Alphaproteobacteria bacterium]
MHLISDENKSQLAVARRTEDLKDTSRYVDCFEGCITKVGDEVTSCQAKGVVWEKIQNAALAAGASKILIHYSSLDIALGENNERAITYLCGVSFYK